jgi:hypothetical protein
VTAVALIAQDTPTAPPPVPYPDGYRQWMHISSAVLPPKPGAANSHPDELKVAAPHGLLHNLYANALALEGYRTGHFPEGAVLIADWFVLEARGPELIQGSRKSINVMIRDARYTETGGWGFEDFDGDSPTTRNVGANAVQSCFKCHQRAEAHEYVFSVLKRSL